MGRYYEPLLGHRRSQEFVFGDLTNEAPKALRSRRRRRPGGMVWGRGVPPAQPTRSLRERRKLPSGVRGGATAEMTNEFWSI